MIGFALRVFLFLSISSPGKAYGILSPSPSPDGKEIAFSYYGDIWIVGSDGGAARRLTDSDAFESTPVWSPDGRYIAFISDRDGSDDIYIIPSSGEEPPRRLTYHSSWDSPYFFNEKGDTLYFGSRRLEYRGALYKVSVAGGTPIKAVDFSFFNARPVPGTDTVLFVRGSTPWWRRKYRGSANWDIWKMSLKDQIPIKLTDFSGRDGWPMYSVVDGRIYFVSNDTADSTAQLFSMKPDGTDRERITDFDDDVRFARISRNGELIVFRVFTDLYTYSVRSGEMKKLEVRVQEDYKNSEYYRRKLTRNATEFALSPDETELAFVVFGDIYVMEIKEDGAGEIRRITHTPEPEKYISWHPKEEKLIFASLKSGNWDIYTVEPASENKFFRDYSFKWKKIISSGSTEKKPLYSPDGKKIAFIRDNGTLYVADSDGKKEKKLFEENDVLWISWSPDSRYIAFSRTELAWREDVYIVPAEGGKAYNVTQHPNDDYKPMWSSDGRRLSFASRTAEGDLWIKYVFLREEDEARDREYWKEMEDSLDSIRPIEIDFEGIKDRIHEVTKLRGGYNYYTQSPDGKLYAIQAGTPSGTDIWTVDWLGEKLKRRTQGGVNPKSITISRDKKHLYYLDRRGKLKRISLDGNASTPLAFEIEIEIPDTALKRALFEEAWWTLRDGFYDPKFHGVDWDFLGEKYRKLVLSRRTDRDLHYAIRMMLGELNASHLGIWKRSKDEEKYTGCLGIEIDHDYKGKGFRVKRVLKKSPAQLRLGLKPGDVLVAVNDEELDNTRNFYSYFRKLSGEKVKITYIRDGKKRLGEVKLTTPWKICDLVYREWVEGNRHIVDSLSNETVAYIHVPGMNTKALNDFYREVYSMRDRKGLLLDIRYNGGGYTHDQMLNFLRRTVYAYSKERGEDEPVYSSALRWGKPVVLLINQNCYSDAEIFPMGFRQLKLGKIVGVTTFGAVIGTSNKTLMDGETVFREPHVGWYRLNGVSLENNPVEPDVYVENPPMYDNRPGGPQLLRALEILMDEIEKSGN